MDVRYINPFIVATQVVFRTMLGINVVITKPVLKNANTTSGEVTGVMGLAGDKKGTIAVSLRRKGAIFVFRALTGDECNDVNPEVVDAIGELTNIISGQARKEFEKAGINLKASIPIVVVGEDVEMNFITKIPIISLPFQFEIPSENGTEKESMYLDFSFE